MKVEWKEMESNTAVITREPLPKLSDAIRAVVDSVKTEGVFNIAYRNMTIQDACSVDKAMRDLYRVLNKLSDLEVKLFNRGK